MFLTMCKRLVSVFSISSVLLALTMCQIDEAASRTAVTPALPPSITLPATSELEIWQGSGQTFYLGQAACDDNGPGSASQPFCTFAAAGAALQPGDTLIVQNGVYLEQVVVDGWQGTAVNPITIRGQSRDGVIFDGGCPGFPCGVNDVPGSWDDETGMINVRSGTHLVLRDLTVQNIIAVGVTLSAGQNITMTNVTVKGTGHAGTLVLYTQGATIAANDIGFVQQGWRDENNNVQIGAHESLSLVGVDGFTVRDNHVHDSLKEGIDIKESATNGQATNNLVERTCLVGIYINEVENVTVQDNRVRAAGYFWDGSGEDLCPNQPTFGSLYGNYYGGGIQVAVGDLGDLSTGWLSDLRLYRNMIWDSVGNGLEFWDELEESGTGDGTMTNIQVYNNVFYNTTFAGIRLEDAQNVSVANNILMLNEEAHLTGDMVGSSMLSHNLFFPAEGAAGIQPVTADPHFIDPTEGDFYLQPDSPAIDAGLDVGLLFAGSAPDIGAYEVDTAVYLPLVTTPPAASPTLPLTEVRYWAYQIQDISAAGAVDALASSPYDMLVIEPTRTDWSSDDRYFATKTAVTQLKNSLAADGLHRKLVIAYIDIGEAEDWRWYWDWSTGWDCTGPKPADWPNYILTCDPDGWSGNYPVAYWDAAWRDIIIYGQNTGTHPDRDYVSVIDEAINDGFDGIYLDWVEGYENEVVAQTAQALGLDPALEMIAFIQEMRTYAQARQPGFLIIQQNAAALADGRPQLFNVIDAIAQEGIWFDGDATDDWYDPNGYDWVNDPDLTDYYLFHLEPYLNAGLPGFACEYALNYAPTAYANALAAGYIPYVTRRSLSQLTTTPPALP